MYIIVQMFRVLHHTIKEGLFQEPQSEVQNNTTKETDCKQEPKIHLIKVATENTQVVEKKVESEAAIVVTQTNSASTVEANGIDNEDSINLTIGEDEENLLAEEVKKLFKS